MSRYLEPLGFLALVTLGCCEPTSLVAAVAWVTVILGACVWAYSRS